ncbi:MAG: class I SAM-dependent methyltransferase [Pseudomonadota bacterium]
MRDPSTFLENSVEKARYETHNNSIENQGYVRFLTPVVDAVCEVTERGARGLDFGSGPGPIIDQLLHPKGYVVENYDPYFDPHHEKLDQVYDFVTCTEAFEHFYEPATEMDRILRCLKPGGFLFLMTQFREDKTHFLKWGYRMDNTHVGFLNHESLHYLCQNWGLECHQSDGRLSVLQKLW